MKSKIEQVLERCLHDREIAVWGTPSRLFLRKLKNYSFRFRIAETVSPQKHYVIAVNDEDLTDFLQDEQSKQYEYANDYICFNDIGGELPFEWDCYGVKVGRQTYFGDNIAGGCENGYIESIGHFTSINSSANIGVNHQLNMIFTSDDIERFFTDENKKRFHQRLNSDSRKPYSLNKNRITIGNDVYIGANTFINASKVTVIGDGAIIGSGAVVLEDVPPYAVVTGVPAKVKRYRFEPDMIEALLHIKWWNWSIDEINANADELMSPELFTKKFM